MTEIYPSLTWLSQTLMVSMASSESEVPGQYHSLDTRFRRPERHFLWWRNLRGTDLTLSRQVGQSALQCPAWSQLGRVLAVGEAWGQCTQSLMLPISRGSHHASSFFVEILGSLLVSLNILKTIFNRSLKSVRTKIS